MTSCPRHLPRPPPQPLPPPGSLHVPRKRTTPPAATCCWSGTASPTSCRPVRSTGPFGAGDGAGWGWLGLAGGGCSPRSQVILLCVCVLFFWGGPFVFLNPGHLYHSSTRRAEKNHVKTSVCPELVSLVRFSWRRFRWVLFRLPGPSIFPKRHL